MDNQRAFAAIPARYPELRGQVALVTGSARGIGKGIAYRLAGAGMRIAGRRSKPMQRTATWRW